MQWSNAPNAGFSLAHVQPWLPVNPNYAQGVNVAEQWADPGSLLHFYRRLLHTRRATPALVAGDYQPLQEDAADYLAFLRHSEAGGQTCLVVLNWSDRTQRLNTGLQLPVTSHRCGAEVCRARLLFSSHQRASEIEPLGELVIAPYEVYVAELVD
jgi:alpha-glucosidase